MIELLVIAAVLVLLVVAAAVRTRRRRPAAPPESVHAERLRAEHLSGDGPTDEQASAERRARPQ